MQSPLYSIGRYFTTSCLNVDKSTIFSTLLLALLPPIPNNKSKMLLAMPLLDRSKDCYGIRSLDDFQCGVHLDIVNDPKCFNGVSGTSKIKSCPYPHHL